LRNAHGKKPSAECWRIDNASPALKSRRWDTGVASGTAGYQRTFVPLRAEAAQAMLEKLSAEGATQLASKDVAHASISMTMPVMHIRIVRVAMGQR
jgi:predicted GNAT superfamily acetyltransferase